MKKSNAVRVIIDVETKLKRTQATFLQVARIAFFCCF
jgi:hypothetical protein